MARKAASAKTMNERQRIKGQNGTPNGINRDVVQKQRLKVELKV